MEANIWVEENGQYALDCRKAIWSSGQLHDEYAAIGNLLNDVDFLVEDVNYIYLIEYKNANVPGAANPGAFNPSGDKKVENVSKKFYDSLHYLNIMQKNKPKKYIYILEYPAGDSVSRRMIRNKLKQFLPFEIQRDKHSLIESVEVLSIEEWNNDSNYKQYPLLNVADIGKNDVEEDMES